MHVFREPIKVDLYQKTSIPHRCHLQSTMFPFQYAENHVQCYGSSTDPEVKASSGRPAATCRLLKLRSMILAVYVDIEDRNKPTFFLL